MYSPEPRVVGGGLHRYHVSKAQVPHQVTPKAAFGNHLPLSSPVPLFVLAIRSVTMKNRFRGASATSLRIGEGPSISTSGEF